MRGLIFAVLLLSSINAVFAAGAKPCTTRDAIAAEDEASVLKDWKSVYKSFESFANCDDGAIAEGYSNSIANLLTDGWGSFGELSALMTKDKRFGKFVINHVDDLMTDKQAEQIYLNVRTKCPATEKKLCKQIENRLDATSPEKLEKMH